MEEKKEVENGESSSWYSRDVQCQNLQLSNFTSLVSWHCSIFSMTMVKIILIFNNIIKIASCCSQQSAGRN